MKGFAIEFSRARSGILSNRAARLQAVTDRSVYCGSPTREIKAIAFTPIEIQPLFKD
jgi:hypothetical protein